MDVAIIGGGIAGLILALTLHKHSIKCTIYELREKQDIAHSGAIALAPNALRVLDKLGMYEEIRQKGWPIRSMQFRDESDELLSTVEIGDVDRYQYEALRIVRAELHSTLLSTVSSAGIPFIIGKKFSHVVSTTPTSVTFAFKDSTQVTSSILIGADGIHSTVRQAIAPEIKPTHVGNLAVSAHLKYNPLLDLPSTPALESRLHSISITKGIQGAFLFIIQSPDGQEMTLARECVFPTLSHEDWNDLFADKQRQYDMLVQGIDRWPKTIQTLIRATEVEDMSRPWPYYSIADLDQWTTPDRKVILVGDAAHAIPPTAGQGAAMAIEDTWSLGLLLAAVSNRDVAIDSDDFKSTVQEWQVDRKNRIVKVRTLTKQMGNQRLPKEVRDKLKQDDFYAGDGKKEMMWLYGYEYQPRISVCQSEQ